MATDTRSGWIIRKKLRFPKMLPSLSVRSLRNRTKRLMSPALPRPGITCQDPEMKTLKLIPRHPASLILRFSSQRKTEQYIRLSLLPLSRSAFRSRRQLQKHLCLDQNPERHKRQIPEFCILPKTAWSRSIPLR